MCNIILYLYGACIYFISFSGLHSFIEMCASGIINGEGIYLVSLFCSNVKLASIMFL